MSFSDRVRGALYGTAIGDAMGAPVEGWSPQRIASRFASFDFLSFLPPTHDRDPEMGKGAGRVTDDTLMTEVLIEAYADARSHLDAYGYRDYILPGVKYRPRWIPEWRQTAVLWDRLWIPEQYPWIRLVANNAEPRVAGIGNMVNCGVAMWMMPVGVVNAGCPQAAYLEAVQIGLAHNESFAVEAGAVMAAAAAEALSAEATIQGVLDVSVRLARDGTGKAIAAALGAAHPSDTAQVLIEKVRAAVAPFDQRTGHVADDALLKPQGLNDVGRPSRISSIEELPVALAALSYGGGDFVKTLRAAVMYGRDCDSIAAMALSLFGALHGTDALPERLCGDVDRANRRDFAALAATLRAAAKDIFENERKAFDRRYRSTS